METVLFTEAQCKTILDAIHGAQMDYDIDPGKNELLFYRGEANVLKFRLPISFASPQNGPDAGRDLRHHVLVIVRSGMAAVGCFEGGKVKDHKVFRAYMVRKKQGKSQLKYLKTKGKSRAGSRLRLAQSLDFFSDINARLGEYFRNFDIDRIGLSCPTTLIPHFFGSKTPPPFPKRDPRILKIPKHIQNPTYEALLQTNRFLLQGEVRYTVEGKELLETFRHEL